MTSFQILKGIILSILIALLIIAIIVLVSEFVSMFLRLISPKYKNHYNETIKELKANAGKRNEN